MIRRILQLVPVLFVVGTPQRRSGSLRKKGFASVSSAQGASDNVNTSSAAGPRERHDLHWRPEDHLPQFSPQRRSGSFRKKGFPSLSSRPRVDNARFDAIDTVRCQPAQDGLPLPVALPFRFTIPVVPQRHLHVRPRAGRATFRPRYLPPEAAIRSQPPEYTTTRPSSSTSISARKPLSRLSYLYRVPESRV
jgi:hypothetical protein